jgi:hypothetical protein
MERKFSFDDMTFVARAERVDGVVRVGIYDAWDDCRLEADYPASDAAPAPAPQPETKGATKAKGGKAKPAGTKAGGTKASATKTAGAEDRAIDDLIASFKRKVEDGEIDLA